MPRLAAHIASRKISCSRSHKTRRCQNCHLKEPSKETIVEDCRPSVAYESNVFHNSHD